ncbi:hypothetical protein A7P95_03195 [Eikenella longinqua]|uniref:Uncharacterized protein n=1 Tax=Eikenella longinqua TaxID=1795827 RepID=A0A1A9RZZ7_9NEIS|nr:hypothetical protein A7P95_03195 [Eikenella longinqua]
MMAGAGAAGLETAGIVARSICFAKREGCLGKGNSFQVAFPSSDNITLFAKPNRGNLVRMIGLHLLLLAQPNGARFFGEQGLACSKRRSRKLRARPKNCVE